MMYIYKLHNVDLLGKKVYMYTLINGCEDQTISMRFFKVSSTDNEGPKVLSTIAEL